jgi:hypothetical protein
MMSESKLFIPNKIKVGFQERNDTYTGRLAYVVYYDQLGKLRKEKSWEGWRSKNIEPLDLDNQPTDGFVLNRGVGGARRSYGWNVRNEYIRVYDPRDFEFEISIANLLFILRECDCSRGKGLEGKFVYAWDGAELVLLPTCSEEYKSSSEFTELQSKKISAKELILGATYMTKSQEKLIYLGRFEKFVPYYPDGYYHYDKKPNIKDCCKKHHVFEVGVNKQLHPEYRFLDSMTTLGAVVSDTPVPDYAEKVQNYYKSKFGSKVVGLSLGKPNKLDPKNHYQKQYFFDNKDGSYIQYCWGRYNTPYVEIQSKVSIENGILKFNRYDYNSYPDGCKMHHRSNRGKMPWDETKYDNRELWAILESGARYKVGRERLMQN